MRDRTTAIAIECRTSIMRAQGRLIVCCEIEHLLPSGLTVAELFARLRPRLTVAIEDAATRDPLAGSMRTPSVQMDVDGPDPGIAFWVHSPALGLADFDACLSRLEAIVTRFVVEHRAGGLCSAHPA